MAAMSTIHLHETTTATPEEFLAGLTDFGPGRLELFGPVANGHPSPCLVEVLDDKSDVDEVGDAEVVRFQPPSAGAQEPAPDANRPGLRHVAFNVDDVRGVVDRVREAGWETIGEIVDYENTFLLCYVRGPEGLIVELAERLGRRAGLNGRQLPSDGDRARRSGGRVGGAAGVAGDHGHPSRQRAAELQGGLERPAAHRHAASPTQLPAARGDRHPARRRASQAAAYGDQDPPPAATFRADLGEAHPCGGEGR